MTELEKQRVRAVVEQACMRKAARDWWMLVLVAATLAMQAVLVGMHLAG